jgi:ABC-type uncharacterized transport system substrate-binding protein
LRTIRRGNRLTRRAFVLVSLAACFGSFGVASGADAQQPASPRRVGVLFADPWGPEMVEGFRQGLLDAGYAEGRDLVFKWQSAHGNYDRLPRLAADLVRGKVDVIVVTDTPSAQAAKRATSSIPVVIAAVADPIGSGLVTSFAHPDANVTGITIRPELSGKRLQLLKEVIPRVARLAVLWNPATPWHTKAIEDLRAVAPSLEMDLSLVAVRTPEQIGPAFSAVSGAHAQALYVIADALFVAHRTTLLKLAAKARLPVIYAERNFAEAGALMSYGANYEDLFRRAADFVDKILKGAKPGDLPIEQPTKFELVVNLKTAKDLEITIPESILLRADEVIR